MISGTNGDVRPAFLFTGLGSQYEGMGEGLFRDHPLFRETIERCDDILGSDLTPGILEVLYGSPGNRPLVHQIEYSCPIAFAVQLALARLWMSWGIAPAHVIGHSVGEYAAATIAGALRMEDGLRLVSRVGRLLKALPWDGRMLAVKADETQVAGVIAQRYPGVSVAAVNSPGAVVVSGGAAAIGHLKTELDEAGVRAVPVKMSQACHAPQIGPMLAGYHEMARSVRFNPPDISYISCLTGAPARDEISRPGYWVSHLSEPVQFMAAMRSLLGRDPTHFIEIGPAPTLLRLGQQCAANGQIRRAGWIASLTPDTDDCETIEAGRASLSAPTAPPTAETPHVAPTPLARLIRSRIAGMIGLPADRIRPGRPLVECGMDSLATVDFVATVERHTGVRLPLHLLNETVTIDDVTAYVSARLAPNRRRALLGAAGAAGAASPEAPLGATGPADEILVPLREAGVAAPLYFVPAGDGDLLAFRNVVSRLDRDHPVFGLRPPSAQAVGRLGDLPMEWLVARYANAIRTAQAAGPYHVFGYSVGGIYAVEVARKLLRDGHAVDLLVVLDPPVHIPGWVAWFYAGLYRSCNLLQLHTLARRANIRWLRRRLHGIADEGLRTHATLARKHDILPYPGHIVHFRSRRSWIRALNLTVIGKSWRSIASAGREVHWIEGTHYELFRGDRSEAFIDTLNHCLRRHLRRCAITS
ncbi:acyltransferase domain-containing protein [Candidatus Palauibacter sp.]|uniref:acyltransferase domain-containing protein n=1 Tax=Candidatus Palauibacter sp. TaxID=3101350 RepID=UPI003C7007AB